MKKVLFVIDMQNVYIGKNHAPYFKYDLDIVESVNKVIDENKNNTVVYIRHIMKKNFINKLVPFNAYEGTKEIELAKELKVVTNYVFDKYVGDAFSNEKLIHFLKEQEIDTVEVIGIDGGGCVSKTAFGAMKNGFNVIVNTKAIGTMLNNKKDKYFKKLKDLGAKFI